jgi:hypothetical protein
MNEDGKEAALLAVRSNAGLGVLPRIKAHLRQLSPHMMQREGVVLLREAHDEIENMRQTVTKLAALAQHSDGCSWITPLPTGEGYWGCDCGLDSLVLDGEPTDVALTPNVEVRYRLVCQA